MLAPLIHFVRCSDAARVLRDWHIEVSLAQLDHSAPRSGHVWWLAHILIIVVWIFAMDLMSSCLPSHPILIRMSLHACLHNGLLLLGVLGRVKPVRVRLFLQLTLNYLVGVYLRQLLSMHIGLCLRLTILAALLDVGWLVLLALDVWGIIDTHRGALGFERLLIKLVMQHVVRILGYLLLWAILNQELLPLNMCLLGRSWNWRWLFVHLLGVVKQLISFVLIA